MIRRFLAALAPVAALLAAAPAAAQLRVDITSGIDQPMPIAVPVFPTPAPVATPAGNTADLGRQLSDVIAADLGGSGLFRPVNRSAYPALQLAEVPAPRLEPLQTAGAQALVAASIAANANGTLDFRCYLYDVLSGEQLVREGLTVTPAGWRRAAHKCADLVYTRLTGESGYFDSRIIYVAESGPVTKRVKRLAIMDQDGANHRFLTSGQWMVLMPRFSPINETITYMSYAGNRARTMLYNVNTGQQQAVGNFNSMTFAGRFSADGSQLVLSVMRGGNSDIYLYDVNARTAKQLTNGNWIDTSPSLSPDGRQIVFESDRGGSQQIYVMNVDGSNPHRISFGAGTAGSPVWSPRGDLVAFTRMGGPEFHIAVMRPDGSGERLLTNAWQDESPSWSPNGRVILFTRVEQSGRSTIHSVDLTGRNERRIPTPLDGSDPSWGPLLK